MEYPAAAAGSGGYKYYYPPQQPQPQPVRRPRRPAARWVKQWCVHVLCRADNFFNASAAPEVRLTVSALHCFFWLRSVHRIPMDLASSGGKCSLFKWVRGTDFTTTKSPPFSSFPCFPPPFRGCMMHRQFLNFERLILGVHWKY